MACEVEHARSEAALKVEAGDTCILMPGAALGSLSKCVGICMAGNGTDCHFVN